jgi:hypothetical protein
VETLTVVIKTSHSDTGNFMSVVRLLRTIGVVRILLSHSARFRKDAPGDFLFMHPL